MNKKLTFLAVLVISTILGVTSVSAACGVWRYKFDVTNVKVNQSLIVEDKVPQVAIGWSRDHTSDLTFYAQLVGAEWNYGNSGKIMRGVTYTKVNKTTLEISVDVGTGSDELNFGGGYNLYLPLDCTIKNAGEIRLIIDGNETTVSNANILIAKAVDGRITVHGNKTPIKQTGSLKKVTVTDTSTQSYKAGTKFTMDIDTGFKFTGEADISGTGKFKDLVRFEVDKNNASRAYLIIAGDTQNMDGEIIMENVGVTRGSDGKFTVAMIKTTFTASVVPVNSTLAVASYLQGEESTTKKAETTTKATTETTTEATTKAVETTTETTTQAETAAVSEIKIKIGADQYTINGETYPLDVPAYISNGSTMLPLRALANAMGIADDKISYDAASKTAVLSQGSYSVSITAGEKKLTVSAVGIDKTEEIASPAEIKDGRIFLPLRAMANALGIDDSAIAYDAAEKTVTIQK